MRPVFILLLLLSQCFVSTAQSNEHLYLHYDRTEFHAGDRVRFKAYVLADGMPSTRATHFYVQVFNTKGLAIAQGHFPVIGATVDGGFSLPDTLSSGNYYIQAFSPVRGAAASTVYVKNIWVDGAGFRSESVVPGKLSELIFSPEGGSLIADQLNLVVIRSLDASGRPVMAKGTIQTASGQILAPFQTLVPGLGLVRFKPRPGVQYLAVLDSAGGFSFPLPAVVSGSIQLQVESERGGKKFQLARSGKVSLLKDAFRLTATTRGQIVYDQEISFGNYPSLVGHLVTDSLPSGILLFELFDADGKRVAKRPCFIDRGEWLSPVQLIRSQDVLVAGTDSVRLELLLPDSLMSSLSLSVMNADLPFPDESIGSRLKVLDEWPFYPEELAAYLEDKNWNVNLLEWLLISTADRTLLSDRAAFSAVDERAVFLGMTGTVLDARSGERLSGGDLTVMLEAASGYTKQWLLTPDEKGSFSIDSIVYSGMGSFYAFYADKKGKVRTVRVESKLIGADSVRTGLLPATIERAGILRKSLVRFNEAVSGDPQATLLAPVKLDRTATKVPEESVDDKLTTGVFREVGKVTIDNTKNPVNDKSINVVDFIKNRIQQVEIQGGRFVNRKNISLSNGQKWQIGLFLNEQPVDMNLLRTIRAMDVTLIKFYEAGFVGSGSNYPGGALAIYTKEKQDNGSSRPEDPFFRGLGFTAVERPGKPIFGVAERMLYWDPTLVIDRSKTNLTFKIPEQISSYRLILSGFDVRGRLIWIQQAYSK